MRLKNIITAASFASAALVSATFMQTAPAAAVPAGCSSVDTIGEWAGLGSTGCTIGDKKFVYDSSDLGSSYVIEFLQGGLSYSFVGDGNLTGAVTKFVAYTVEVLDPDYVITQVLLDSTVSIANGGAPSTSVTKTIRDTSSTGTILDTLTSTDGSTDASIALANTKLFIRDDLNVAADDTLSSFTNTIVQTSTVPEPATLTILGMGLLGLGALRRRKA